MMSCNRHIWEGPEGGGGHKVSQNAGSQIPTLCQGAANVAEPYGTITLQQLHIRSALTYAVSSVGQSSQM